MLATAYNSLVILLDAVSYAGNPLSLTESGRRLLNSTIPSLVFVLGYLSNGSKSLAVVVIFPSERKIINESSDIWFPAL